MIRATSKGSTLFKNEIFKAVRNELLRLREIKTLAAVCRETGLSQPICSLICTAQPNSVGVDRLLECCEKLDISVTLTLSNKDETTTVHFKGIK